MKSRLTGFTRTVFSFEKFLLWSYLVSLSANVFYSILSFNGLNTYIMLGHFYDLGIQFLLDPAYLFFLFPDRLYCYIRNEKGEELYAENLILSNNHVNGTFFLAIWFTLVVSLLLNASLIAQVIALTYSKTCRFRRLKKLLSSTDEELLGHLSKENLVFSMRLEILEVILNPSKFRELFGNLKTFMSFEEKKRCSTIGPSQILMLK